MLPLHADPVLIEVADIAADLKLVRRARAADPESSELQAEHALLQTRLDELLANPDHRTVIDRALTDRARILRIAALALRAEGEADRQDARRHARIAEAARAGRELTPGERRTIDDLARSAVSTTASAAWETEITDEWTRDAVLEALGMARVKRAREELRDGLLLTQQMREIIAESTPALHRGDPVLFIGETGGAKTALTEYLSRRILGAEPEFVSGYGDITSSQVIGSHELRAVSGATVTEFVYGPLLRAMVEGRPLILDELNAMPAEFLKRLNRILQLRPGDTFSVQENAGRPVTIRTGFVILATANEQTPHRYRGLDRLSSELMNRFGANTYRVHYPDSGSDYTDVPRENLLLAMAAVADAHGELPRSLPLHEIERVARVAFISQQVFAGIHGEGFSAYVSTERELDGRPGLEESVLAPRTLVAILEKAAGGAGSISIERAMQRFIEGVMHREDRRVLALIAEGQGFLTVPRINAAALE